MSIPNYVIYLYLRKERPNKDGKLPVYLRLTINKERMQYPTGQYIHPSLWDDKLQKAVKTDEAATINSVLTSAKAEIDHAISHLYISKSDINFENIRKLLRGEAVQQEHKFLETAQEHNDNFEKLVGTKYSYGSFKNYKTTLKYLKEF